MESASGKITALNGERAVVLVKAPLACRRCASGKGCGAGIFQDAAQSKSVVVKIPAGVRAEVGDEVRLSIAPGYLLRAAMLAYGVPLASMLALPGIVWSIWGLRGDASGVVVSIIGLLTGLVISRRALQNDALCHHFVPAVGDLH